VKLPTAYKNGPLWTPMAMPKTVKCYRIDEKAGEKAIDE
jgi:hypothetical protein